MKTKLVLWGTNAQDERVLIALELRPKDNKVDVYTFPESVATEEFSQKMMNEWRNDNALDFPEGFTKSERELTITESLLPDDLKVERGDVITRAQTEWAFVVLSTKLSEAYQHELAEFKERVEKIEAFDDELWAGLKNFWDKVQVQVRERNLFREHADMLRDHTNALFARMKEMRNKLDEDFQRKSKDNMARFFGALEEIENKIKEGLRLQPLFDKLKELQREFRDTEFTREHRSKVWERLDAAFKSAKGQREEGGGGGGGEASPGERLQRRFDGLMSAIDKMEQSIRRDREELDFQNRRIASTDGQLEAQIRSAKIKMIEERIRSKEEKLHEMNSTRVDLEKRLAQQRDRDAKRAERDKLEEAKKIAQEKIAQEIKAAAVAREAEEEKLAKAAEAISSEKTPKKKSKKDSLLGAIGATLGESLEDAVDTVKAVAEVVGDKVEEAVEKAVEDIKEAWQEATEPAVAEAEEPAAETAEPTMEAAEEPPVAEAETPTAEPEPEEETAGKDPGEKSAEGEDIA